jgi:SAM-dependent methyltransferase
MILRSWLEHPLTRGLDIDSPATTKIRKQIILGNKFLFQIYCDWYQHIAEAVSRAPKGQVVEMGSGGGFLEEFIDGLITSDLLHIPGLKLIFDGRKLPFADDSLSAIVMVDVLHHVPRAALFLKEAERCLKPGGFVVMIEPWMTAWSRIVYTRLHNEPCIVDDPVWDFPATGPLSGANLALPWVIFQRDLARFKSENPLLAVECLELLMPFAYLVSGGVSFRPLMPGWSYPIWKGIEKLMSPFLSLSAMFAFIRLQKI